LILCNFYLDIRIMKNKALLIARLYRSLNRFNACIINGLNSIEINKSCFIYDFPFYVLLLKVKTLMATIDDTNMV
jgi:hypothetical protein